MAEENVVDSDVSEECICFYIFTFDDITFLELIEFDDYSSSCDDLVSFLNFLHLHKVKYNLFTLMGPMFTPEIFDYYMNDPYSFITYVNINEDSES